MIITIREATKNDYKEVMKLFDDFYDGKRNFTSHKEDSFNRILDEKLGFIYVAEEGDKIIGFITASTRYVVRYAKQTMQVEELYVVSSYRKHGIGARLMQTIEEKAKTLDCIAVFLDSRSDKKVAHTFYEGLGYKNEGYYFKKVL